MSRILVVEDEQHIADGLRFNLEAEGHDVTIAPDGERALASILEDRHPYDVVVLDVMLPGRDGFAVASTLRASSGGPTASAGGSCAATAWVSSWAFRPPTCGSSTTARR